MALIVGLAVVFAALCGGCGGGAADDPPATPGSAQGTASSPKSEDPRLPVLGGSWDRVTVEGAGYPVHLGKEIITISGGGYDNASMLGYRFDPRTERSRPLPRVPLPWRGGYSVVGTDHEVIVWGGSGGVAGPQGARYDSIVNAWSVIAASPLKIRFEHTAVWDGEEMLVWGGASGCCCGGPLERDGAAYDPELDAWRPIADPPIAGRIWHTAVWTGNQVLLWGGASEWGEDCEPVQLRSNGAAYSPAQDRWSRIPPAPITATWNSDAVWTGREMLVWNGRVGATYRPGDSAWRSIARPPHSFLGAGAASAFVVWSGDELIVWGGAPRRRGPKTGEAVVGAYDPRTDRWATLTPPPERIGEPQVGLWAGGSMLALADDCCHGRKLRSSARFTPAGPSGR